MAVQIVFVSFFPVFPTLLQFPGQLYAYFLERPVSVDESVDDVDHLVENFFDNGLAQFAFGQRRQVCRQLPGQVLFAGERPAVIVAGHETGIGVDIALPQVGQYAAHGKTRQVAVAGFGKIEFYQCFAHGIVVDVKFLFENAVERVDVAYRVECVPQLVQGLLLEGRVDDEL